MGMGICWESPGESWERPWKQSRVKSPSKIESRSHLATKKAKKHLTRGKKIEATKPLKAAGSSSLFNSTGNGTHISTSELTVGGLFSEAAGETGS
jgi:hypothetical protein